MPKSSAEMKPCNPQELGAVVENPLVWRNVEAFVFQQTGRPLPTEEDVLRWTQITRAEDEEGLLRALYSVSEEIVDESPVYDSGNDTLDTAHAGNEQLLIASSLFSHYPVPQNVQLVQALIGKNDGSVNQALIEILYPTGPDTIPNRTPAHRLFVTILYAQARRAMRAAPKLSQGFNPNNDADVARWLDENCPLLIGQSDHKILGPNCAFGVAIEEMQNVLGIPNKEESMIMGSPEYRTKVSELDESLIMNGKLVRKIEELQAKLASADKISENLRSDLAQATTEIVRLKAVQDRFPTAATTTSTSTVAEAVRPEGETMPKSEQAKLRAVLSSFYEGEKGIPPALKILLTESQPTQIIADVTVFFEVLLRKCIRPKDALRSHLDLPEYFKASRPHNPFLSTYFFVDYLTRGEWDRFYEDSAREVFGNRFVDGLKAVHEEKGDMAIKLIKDMVTQSLAEMQKSAGRSAAVSAGTSASLASVSAGEVK